MSTSETNVGGLCREVEERIAEVLDGSAPKELFEHIADCDACRDLKYDAERAAEFVGHAGGDFRADAGFMDKVLARLDVENLKPPAGVAPKSVEAAVSAPRTTKSVIAEDRVSEPVATDIATAKTEVATEPPRTRTNTLVSKVSEGGLGSTQPSETVNDEVKAAQPAQAITGREAPRSREPEAKSGATGAARTAPPRTTKGSEGGKVVSLFRRPKFVAGLLGAMAAAAAAGFYLKSPKQGPEELRFEAAWSGKIDSISRASADKEGGLEACDANGACKPVKPGWAWTNGTTLRTDARTRAYVSLADGSQLALDRGSSVSLEGGKVRQAKLVEGTIVADVASLKHGPSAKISVDGGEVEVVGTKLVMTASKGRASVEVARGAVLVHSAASGKPVAVRAGEEATIEKGREPLVASTSSVADSLEWSDRSPEELDAPVLRGLGELRARKPGQTTEKDHAVRLAKHAVKVRIVDVVARTEVDETFTNDTDEELEGIFRFPLPPGAQIEKLALEVDGKMMEGAFVDRDKGAAIWRGVIQNAAPKTPKPREEIIWVPGPWRDPALLEWQRGGRFELKIFPIPKRGSRRVVLTYTQTVDQSAGVRRFTYPLAHDPSGTTKIDAFDLDLQVLGHDKEFGVQTRGYELAPSGGDASAERRTMSATGFVPAGDLTVEYALPDRDREATAWAYRMDSTSAPLPEEPKDGPAATKAKTTEEKDAAAAARAIAFDSSPYVAIALRPKLPRWQEAKERVHAIVVDTSRSMVGERFARATRLASTIVREMDRRDSFVLLACDTVCRPMTQDGRSGLPTPIAPGSASAGEVERFLGSVEPDGGSDMAAAVSAARSAAGSLGGKELRIVYLGDGTPTVGPTRPSHIEAAVRSSLPGSDGSVVAVAMGADADLTSLAALARGGGGVVVPYVPGQKVSSAALDVLSAAYGVTLRDPEIELPAGLTQVTPARLDPIRAGGETFVVARMSSGDAIEGAVRLRGRVASERFEQTYPLKILATSSAGNAFVPRLYAAAKIAELENTGGAASKLAAIELSKRFAVASRFTSLLVLESEAMMNAFGLERTRVAPTFTGEVLAQSSNADAEGEEKAADEAKEEAEASAELDTRGPEPSKKGGASAPAAAAAPFDAFDDSAAAPPPPAAPAATATAAPTPKPAPRAISGEGWGGGGRGDSGIGRPGWRDQRPSQRLVPMRRIFERKGSFEALNTLASQNASKLLAAESALASTPDSRDKTVDLFALYATAGRLGEAQELTAKWSGRDALDPDALTARADLAARQGDRERAIRILGGLADVRPGDRATQTRLAKMHEASGNQALACEHRIALADMAPGEAKLVADAVRCANTLGMTELASLLKLDASETVRASIDKLLALPGPPPSSLLTGDIQVSAEWTGGVDLDIGLIDAQGRRTSWLGSPGKALLSARDVTSTRTEALGLVNTPSGSYVVEIARASGADQNIPVRGELTLKLAGETRKVPFVLTGPRAEVGTMRVFFTSRLVPVTDVPFNPWGP
ncbi:VIT domain-containing protein [Polyangium sp. y55x31]|uniref:VIT domain-containing protein n=1 Tax=Polyangium sp. y55x31 TaxID=3042688 RepID=UPI002482885F|nr:VIT domain-containing protein [Polyangium sp. y55x31]MDI1482600.1 VIT domain-containing protein [Polyangium sp. y55x31]